MLNNWYISMVAAQGNGIKVNSYKALSDNELVHLLRQDDEQALSTLYLRYWDKLLTVACNRLNEPEEAEEIVQDIFFWLWEHRLTIQLKYSLSTYLAVAVKYRVINRMDTLYRKRNREAKLPDYTALLQPSPEEAIFENELRDRLEATVKRLPKKCRIIFRKSREEGMTYKQIASELEISEKTVEAHMSKALKDIRSNLSAIIPSAIILLLANDSFLA